MSHYNKIRFAAADVAVTSSTTLATITGLSFPVLASRSYGFRAVVPFAVAGVVSGFKFAVAGPASPTNVIYSAQMVNGVTPAIGVAPVNVALGTAIAGALLDIGSHCFVVEGVLENGVTAGNLVIQAAQNVSDGAALTVKRGAFLTVWPV